MTLTRERIFQLFKYAVYGFLAVNTAYFFFESLAGLRFVERDGLDWGEVIVAFASPIDTAAWLVLLLAFEMETYVVDDEDLRGRIAWAFAGVNVVCYAIIVYSFFGYVGVGAIPAGFAAYAGAPPCDLAGTGASLARSLDKYDPLTAANCASLGAAPVFNAGLDMFATPAIRDRMAWLATLDIVNSGSWLIVVTILQVEVLLTATRRLSEAMSNVFRIMKYSLYAVLAFAAFEWARLGAPWDAWDALLWLVAFFFIELNILSWQSETGTAADAG
ncbi:MAG: hypothetical protein ACFB00_03975 [Parvularculaceae bacterium]